MMTDWQVLSFLKNIFMFLIDRCYREWKYIRGHGRTYCERTSGRGDLYAEQFIENVIQDRGWKYDPYTVNGNSTISCGAASVVLGKAHVTGLNTLYRTNKCFLTDGGSREYISLNLGAGPLTYCREVVLKFGYLERKAVFLASVNSIKTSVDFSVQKETGRKGCLLNFAINELNAFNLSINGFGYFDWAINLFLNFITCVLWRVFRNLLENELEHYILDRLPKNQFPVEGTSCTNRTKFNTPSEDIRNKEPLFDAFCNKQDQEKPKRSLVIQNCVCDQEEKRNLMEYDFAKELEFKPQFTKSSSQINESTIEIKSLPKRNLNFGSEFLFENPSEISTVESNEDYASSSALPKQPINIIKELYEINKSVDSISEIWPHKIYIRNDLSDLEDITSEESDDVNEIESNSRESTNSDTSSPSESMDSKTSSPKKEFGLRNLKKKEFHVYEKRESIEEFIQMMLGSCRDKTEVIKDFQENIGKLSFFHNIFSETVDGDDLDSDMELSTSIGYASSPSTKIESSQIDVKVLQVEAEPSSIETRAISVAALNLNDEMKENQIEQGQKSSIDFEEKAEDSNKNRHVPAESCINFKSPEGKITALNRDLKSTNIKTIPSGLLFDPKNEAQIEDPESIKSYFTELVSGNQGLEMSETLYNSDSEDRVDSLTGNESIISNSMEPDIIKDESTDSEAGIETMSTSFQLNKMHETEVNGKILFKNTVDVHIGEDEFNEDALREDESYTSDGWEGNKRFNFTYLNESNVPNLQGFSCLYNQMNKRVFKFSSKSGLEVNVDLQKNSLAGATDLKSTHNLQEEIISKTLKLKSALVLNSDPEDIEYSGRFPVSNCENSYFGMERLRLDEEFRLLEKDSETKDLMVPCLPKVNVPSLSLTENSTESDIEIRELISSERVDELV